MKQAVGSGGTELEDSIRAALGPGTPDENIQDTLKTMKLFPTLGELDEFEKVPRKAPSLWEALSGAKDTYDPRNQSQLQTGNWGRSVESPRL